MKRQNNISIEEYDELQLQILLNITSNALYLKKISADFLDELELKAVIRNDLMTAEIAHIANSI